MQAFYAPTVVVMHPREALKFQVAKDTSERYLFARFSEMFPNVSVVQDANVPVTLGAGTNESFILVGDLKAAGYYFNRQPLTLDSSSDAGFFTDETVFRAVMRYGFAVVQPDGVEILTGVQP